MNIQTMNPLITSNPSIRFGKPCITGTRISVDDIKQYVASGMSQDEILADFPDLKPEHIQAAIAYQGPTRVCPSEGDRFYYGWEDEISVGEVKEILRKGRMPTFFVD